MRGKSRWQTILLCIVLVSLGCRTAVQGASDSGSGPLGETSDEIAKRYGAALRHNARVRHHEVLEGGSPMDGDLYEKNAIIIRVVYHLDHAVLLEYTKVAGALTMDDVNSLLSTSAAGFTWEMGKDSSDSNRMYHRSDNRAVAHYTAEYDGSLLIASEGATEFDEKLLP